ncbi:MAG: glycosyl hydrolase [Halolamina sp.]
MSDHNRTSRFDLSRRTFVQGVGASGLAGAGTSVAAAAIDDEHVENVGSGSFTTTIPDGYDYPSPPDPSYVTEDVSPPIPTNDWWSGLLFGTYSAGPVIGDPYHGEAESTGFTATYPTDWDGDPADQDTILADTAQTPGVTIGHADVEEFSDARVNDWGDWHVQTTWGAGTDRHMDVTIARGLPLFFAEYSGGGAQLTFTTDDGPVDDAAVSAWADRGNVLGITVSANGYDKHFGVFAPSGASWSGTSTSEMVSELGDGDYLTVAVLPGASTDLLDQFEAYAYNVVRDTTVDWEYVPDDGGTPVSEVRTTYSFTTESKSESQAEGTVTALFPHQWKYADTELTGRTYWSVRGEMRVATGESFTTTHTYDGILPFTPTSGIQDPETLRSYVTRLADEYDPYAFDVPTSAYWVGKDFYRNSTAAALADRTDQTAERDYFLSAITERIEGWLSADDTALGTEAGQELFYYDDDLGSLFEFPTDFGSVEYITDHHFHYGYFVYAAAEVARQEPGWAETSNWGGMVERLVRDYANWERPDPETDSDPAADPKNAFPFLRNFDVYGGHSWAGGTVGNQKGNNQESSSEAVMAYAAMIRWGELTGNRELRDAGIFLYTQETAAVWDYWFDPEDDSLPDDWGREVSTFESAGPDFEYASAVWGAGYWRHLWWSPSDPVETFAINWLPIGGHSFYLGRDTRYAHSNWSAMLTARERHLDTDDPASEFFSGWEPAALGYRALSDPADAAGLMADTLPIEPGGNSTPFVYNYVSFLVDAGLVDTGVVADAPFYRVFEDGERRTYVAFNASDDARQVSFSDGMTVTVPAGEVVVTKSAEYYEADTGAPTTPADLTVATTNSWAAEMEWSASADDSAIQYYVVSLDGTTYETVSDPGVRIEGLDRGTEYTVAVSAVDTFGNESERTSVTMTTDSEDTAPPVAPADLQTPGKTKTTVDLAWSPTSDVGEGSGIKSYLVIVDGERYTEVSETMISVTDLDPGTSYTFAVRAIDGAGNRSEPVSTTVATLSESATQSPFEGRATIPGKVEGEHFDVGGEGVSYHETTHDNQGSADYRDAPVDIGGSDGDYTLGWIEEGEWLEYSVAVESSESYDVEVRVASAEGGGPLHLEVDGEDVTGSVDVPNTGSWTAYQTVTAAEDVSLSEGEHEVRVVSEGGLWNFDWFAFRRTDNGSTPADEPTDEPSDEPTDTPQQQSKTTPPETTGSGDGPGFGILVALLGAAGLGARLLQNDEEDS